jgi:hypothetical protein
MVSQCTCEWDEELMLAELVAFLGVWRSVTPDLQAVEVWVEWTDAEEARLRMMLDEAGLLCTVHEDWLHSSFATGFQWVR